jgi:hypothetical protein
MEPTECSGHSHDHHDHGEDLGLSLRPHIDLDGVQCLNELVPNSGRAVLKLHEERLSVHPACKSQEDDPELLLYIPFTEAVTIQSIAIRSVSANDEESYPPRKIKLFTNRDDLDFDTARELDATCRLELLPPHHFVEGTIDYPLRPAGRFQNISSLTIFVEDNYGSENNDSSTIITFVGVKGKGSRQKRMAVETVYESQGMPKDHKVRGEHGNTQFL